MWKAAFTGRSEKSSASQPRSRASGNETGGAPSSRKATDDRPRSERSRGSTYDDDSSVYGTAPSSRRTEPRGLKESLVNQPDPDDAWEDDGKSARRERRSTRSETGLRRRKSEREGGDAPSGGDKDSERRKTGRKESTTPRGKSRALDGEQDRAIPEMGSFAQFPGQYAGGVMGNAGQADHATEAGAMSTADNQFGLSRAESFGAAADYYLDEGQSVGQQPGIRTSTPNMLVNPDHHLMAATAEEHAAQDTGHGAAADFYDGKVSPVPFGTTSSIPGKQPSGSSKPSKLGRTSSLGAAAAAAVALGAAKISGSQSNSHSQSYSSAQYTNGGSMSSSKLSRRPNRQNSAPVTSGSSSAYYGASSQGQQGANGIGKQPANSTNSNAGLYAAGAAAVGAAGLAGYEMHEHSQQQQYNQRDSDYAASTQQYNGGQNGGPSNYGPSGVAAAYTNKPSPRQYHEHKGPMTRLKDGLLNLISSEEDVIKMEAYTEYIGVCKYCFDPRTTPYDAPRVHHYHGASRRDSFESLRKRRSMERMRRPSKEGLNRTGTNRVDKDTRYSDTIKRRKSSDKADLIGTGLAAAGMAAGANALFKDGTNFDDTYSVQSGHRESSAVRRRSRSSSRERRGKATYGVVDGTSREEYVTVRTKDGRVERRKVRRRSRSNSKDRVAGLAAAAGGAAIGASAIAASSSRPGRRRSPNRARRSRSSSRSKDQGGIFGGFFSPPRNGSRCGSNDPRRKKQSGFFGFSNDSMSSHEDLAFGASRTDLPLRRKSSVKKVKRKNSDERIAATVAGIGVTAAALAAAQNGQRVKPGNKAELGARRDTKVTPVTGPTQRDDSSEEDWEDELPSDANDSTSGSELAYGGDRRYLPKRHSMESVSSQSSSGGFLGWRWGRRDKKQRQRPSDPSTSFQQAPESSFARPAVAGMAAGAAAGGLMRIEGDSVPTTSFKQRPMQEVDPRPISDVGSLPPSRQQSMPGAFEPTDEFIRPEPAPIQHPKPIAPINPSFTQSPPPMDDTDQTRRISPRRSQSSPTGHSTFVQDAALIGAAALGTAAVISSQGRKSKESSNVRFGLTEEQERKQREASNRDKEHQEEERQRSDRERVLKEEAARHTREQDVLRAREAENRRIAEARLEEQRAAQIEAERVADVQRQQERVRIEREAAFQRDQARRAEEVRAAEEARRAEEARQQDIVRERQDRDDAERRQRKRDSLDRRQSDCRNQQPYLPADAFDGQRQKEQSGASHSQSAVSWDAIAAGAAVVGGGAYAMHEYDQRKDNGRDDRPEDVEDYKIKEIEPPSSRAEQTFTGEDIWDPEAFRRGNRSPADYARHADLARRAASEVMEADEILAEHESRYNEPSQSQADFFAPDILAKKAEGKEAVADPIDGNDISVHRSADDEHRDLFEREWAVAPQSRTKFAPYGVPKLGLVSPTPPPDASVLRRRRATSPSPLAAFESAVAEVDTKPEQRRRSISWGVDRTHVYDVPTPEPDHDRESYMSSPMSSDTVAAAAAAAAMGASAQSDNGSQVDINGRDSSSQANDQARNLASVYQQPSLESVQDVDLPSLPADQTRTELDQRDMNHAEDLALRKDVQPHVPGGFDDDQSGGPVEAVTPESKEPETYSVDRQANESRKGYAGNQSPQTEPADKSYADSMSELRDEGGMRPAPERKLSKKDKKKRDKAAGKAANVANEERNTDITDSAITAQREEPSTRDNRIGRTNASKRSGFANVAEALMTTGGIAAVAADLDRKTETPAIQGRDEDNSEGSDLVGTAFGNAERTSEAPSTVPEEPAGAMPDGWQAEERDEVVQPQSDELLPEGIDPFQYQVNDDWQPHFPPTNKALPSTAVQETTVSPREADHAKVDPLATDPGSNIDLRDESQDADPTSSSGNTAAVTALSALDEEAGRPHSKLRDDRRRSESLRRSSLGDADSTASDRRSSDVDRSRYSRDGEPEIENYDASQPSTISRSSGSGKASTKSKRRSSTKDDDSASVTSSSSRRSKETSDAPKSKRSSGIFGGLFSSSKSSKSSKSSSSQKSKKESASRESSRTAKETDRKEDESANRRGSRTESEYADDDRIMQGGPDSRLDGVNAEDQEATANLQTREGDHDNEDHDDERTANDERARDDQSFLEVRVGTTSALPTDSAVFSASAPADQHQASGIVEPVAFGRDAEDVSRQLGDSLVRALPEDPTNDATIASPVAALSDLESQRRMSVNRPISTTAVPLRFPGSQPPTPSPRTDRTVSLQGSSPASPATPLSAQKTRQNRPGSTEFRPLYLLERNRKTTEVEDTLPSLPSSKTTSRASSQIGSDEYEDAIENAGPSSRRRGLSIDVNRALSYQPDSDYLDSQQTTPKASEAPALILDRSAKQKPQFYTWDDFARDERMRDTEVDGQDMGAPGDALQDPSRTDGGQEVSLTTGAVLASAALLAYEPSRKDRASREGDALGFEEASKDADMSGIDQDVEPERSMEQGGIWNSQTSSVSNPSHDMSELDNFMDAEERMEEGVPYERQSVTMQDVNTPVIVPNEPSGGSKRPSSRDLIEELADDASSSVLPTIEQWSVPDIERLNSFRAQESTLAASAGASTEEPRSSSKGVSAEEAISVPANQSSSKSARKQSKKDKKKQSRVSWQDFEEPSIAVEQQPNDVVMNKSMESDLLEEIAAVEISQGVEAPSEIVAGDPPEHARAVASNDELQESSGEVEARAGQTNAFAGKRLTTETSALQDPGHTWETEKVAQALTIEEPLVHAETPDAGIADQQQAEEPSTVIDQDDTMDFAPVIKRKKSKKEKRKQQRQQDSTWDLDETPQADEDKSNAQNSSVVPETEDADTPERQTVSQQTDARYGRTLVSAQKREAALEDTFVLPSTATEEEKILERQHEAEEAPDAAQPESNDANAEQQSADQPADEFVWSTRSKKQGKKDKKAKKQQKTTTFLPSSAVENEEPSYQVGPSNQMQDLDAMQDLREIGALETSTVEHERAPDIVPLVVDPVSAPMIPAEVPESMQQGGSLPGRLVDNDRASNHGVLTDVSVDEVAGDELVVDHVEQSISLPAADEPQGLQGELEIAVPPSDVATEPFTEPADDQDAFWMRSSSKKKKDKKGKKSKFAVSESADEPKPSNDAQTLASVEDAVSGDTTTEIDSADIWQVPVKTKKGKKDKKKTAAPSLIQSEDVNMADEEQAIPETTQPGGEIIRPRTYDEEAIGDIPAVERSLSGDAETEMHADDLSPHHQASDRSPGLLPDADLETSDYVDGPQAVTVEQDSFDQEAMLGTQVAEERTVLPPESTNTSNADTLSRNTEDTLALAQSLPAPVSNVDLSHGGQDHHEDTTPVAENPEPMDIDDREPAEEAAAFVVKSSKKDKKEKKKAKKSRTSTVDYWSEDPQSEPTVAVLDEEKRVVPDESMEAPTADKEISSSDPVTARLADKDETSEPIPMEMVDANEKHIPNELVEPAVGTMADEKAVQAEPSQGDDEDEWPSFSSKRTKKEKKKSAKLASQAPDPPTGEPLPEPLPATSEDIDPHTLVQDVLATIEIIGMPENRRVSSSRDNIEPNAGEEDWSGFSSKRSKKDKKKAVKLGSTNAAISAKDPQTVKIPPAKEEDLGRKLSIVPDSVSQSLPAPGEDIDPAVAEDEWAGFSTKRSKKDKKKAKKPAPTEAAFAVDQISESVPQPAQPIDSDERSNELSRAGEAPSSEMDDIVDTVAPEVGNPLADEDDQHVQLGGSGTQFDAYVQPAVHAREEHIGGNALDMLPPARLSDTANDRQSDYLESVPTIISQPQDTHSPEAMVDDEPGTSDHHHEPEHDAADALATSGARIILGSDQMPDTQKAQVEPTFDSPRQLSPSNDDRDSEFATTLAAGLTSFGFDAANVLDNPIFQRRSSAEMVAEADPEEWPTVKVKNKKKSRKDKWNFADGETAAEEPSHRSSSSATPLSARDDFTQTLAGTLVGAGFNAALLDRVESDDKASTDDFGENSTIPFSASKRKKSKKSKARGLGLLGETDLGNRPLSMTGERIEEAGPGLGAELARNDDLQLKPSPNEANDLPSREVDTEIGSGRNSLEASDPIAAEMTEEQPQALPEERELDIDEMDNAYKVFKKSKKGKKKQRAAELEATGATDVSHFPEPRENDFASATKGNLVDTSNARDLQQSFDSTLVTDESNAKRYRSDDHLGQESMTIGPNDATTVAAASLAATGIGYELAQSRENEQDVASAQRANDNDREVLAKDSSSNEDRLPWSFENLQDKEQYPSASAAADDADHQIIRDSGYATAYSPQLSRRSGASMEGDVNSRHGYSTQQSLHERRSGEQLHIDPRTASQWEDASPRSRDRQGDSLFEALGEDQSGGNEREATPLDPTTRNRGSYLFQATPDALERTAYPGSGSPTPVSRSRSPHEQYTMSSAYEPEATSQHIDEAALSPSVMDTLSPRSTLGTIAEEQQGQKRTITETDAAVHDAGKAPRRSETPHSMRSRDRASSLTHSHGPSLPMDTTREVSAPHTSDEYAGRPSRFTADGLHNMSKTESDKPIRKPRQTSNDFRSASAMSNRSSASASYARDAADLRSASRASNRSSTPTLRRTSLSGDLRTASRRGDSGSASGSAVGARASPKTIPFQAPPTPPSNDDEVMDASASRSVNMSDVYVSQSAIVDNFGADVLLQQGYGDVEASQHSPTRPPNMRKRQSMHVLELQSKLDELAAENERLQNAYQARSLDSAALGPDQDADRRDLQLREKDNEINQIRIMLQPLQEEIRRLNDINADLVEANRSMVDDSNGRLANMQAEHAQTHEQWQSTSRELDNVRDEHGRLTSDMREVVESEIATALADKNSEIRQLREDLEMATERIRALQTQIQSTTARDFLSVRDEDYFDGACQKLCQHVQQWVLRFSKLSDDRRCRLSTDLNDERVETRLDNVALDGSDVDKLLADRTKRRDVFMSLVMTMMWEYIFARYLFGMDREQRKILKDLQVLLEEAGPKRAVSQWRATTLTLLSKRPAFAEQRALDTQAVAGEVFTLLCRLLPPPSKEEAQLMSSLERVVNVAVDLAIEMKCQRAEYIMLPPLQPEYDTNGDLVQKVYFNSSLMNERSGTFSSNGELEQSRAIVKIVLFPLVVKKGDDSGEGEQEIVVCPAQVLVQNDNKGKRIVRMQSGAMEIDDPRRSSNSLATPSTMVL